MTTKVITALALSGVNLGLALAVFWATTTCATYRLTRITFSAFFEVALALGGFAAYWGMSHGGGTIGGMVGVFVAFVIANGFSLVLTTSTDDGPYLAIGTRRRSVRLRRSERRQLAKARRTAELARRTAELEREVGIKD